jgi:hypothetical protein
MSWVTFLLSPTELSNRCSISLTLILALNVFQLLINESTPKTDYLTPMHEFIITSTFMVVCAALESVLVHIAHRRVSMKGAVLRTFGSRRSVVRKFFDKVRSKPKATARSSESQTNEASDDSQAKARFHVGAARVYVFSDVEKGLPPGAAGGESSGTAGDVELRDAPASAEECTADPADSKPSRPRWQSSKLLARLEVLVTARADALSLVLFPVVYIGTMCYIFGAGR